MRRWWAGRSVGVPVLATLALFACGGGGGPEPDAGFGVLRGRTVLVLPVQIVQRVDGRWIGGARGDGDAARLVDREIEFALREEGARVSWISPSEQVDLLRRRPMIQVDPYALSVEELRDDAERGAAVRDPLYGEIRPLAALFDTRLAVWPLEVLYEADDAGPGRIGIRTLLLDLRAGRVLWEGTVFGTPSAPTARGGVASAAQAFALQVSP